jgi:hypothetical protein
MSRGTATPPRLTAAFKHGRSDLPSDVREQRS